MKTNNNEIFIIGGAEYTKINATIDHLHDHCSSRLLGMLFPELNMDDWQRVERDKAADSDNNAYSFILLEKANAVGWISAKRNPQTLVVVALALIHPTTVHCDGPVF